MTASSTGLRGSATMPDVFWLRVTEGNAKDSEISLDTGELVIGRLGDDDGRLGDDPEISRRHARISSDADGQLRIEDLGSTNGTRVNGRRIEGRVTLRPGDTIGVGRSELVVEDPAGESAQPTVMGTVREPRPPAPPARPPRIEAFVPTPDPGRRSQKRPGLPGWLTEARGLMAAVAVAVVAAAVVAVVALARGGDDPQPAPKPATLTVRELIRKGSPSTVEINTRGPVFTPRGKSVASGGGSGIVVDAARGHILTNAHVVSGQTSIKAQTAGGQEVSARVISQAPCEDLALISLRPNPKGLVDASLGASAAIQAGDRVTALGYPAAFEERLSDRRLQASDGIVSAASGKTSLGPASPAFPDVIQHQAPLNPGNSGGPLFNQRGQVIGVNTFTRATESSQNQNAAIAVDRARALLGDLAAGRNTGYVGWNVVPLKPGQLPLRPRTTGRRGSALVVLSVDAGSAASKKRFAFGDTIAEIDGTPVRSFQDACDILNSKASGDTITVEGYRLPPIGLLGARLNRVQSVILTSALRFRRTVKLT